MTVKPAEINL